MNFKAQLAITVLMLPCSLGLQNVRSFSMDLPSNVNLISANSIVQSAPQEGVPDKSVPKESSASEKPPSGEVPVSGDPTKVSPTSSEKPVSLLDSLQKALVQKDYREADQITYKLMLESAGPISKAQGRLDRGEWGSFSCSDLREIDRLWREATEGTQGFSAQKAIFIESKKVAQAFQTRIGWRDKAGKWIVVSQYSSVNKTLEYEKGKEPEFTNPPRGHLPAKLAWDDKYDHRFDKVYACKL